MKLERRYTAHEVRVANDDASNPKITGYAVVFGVRSEDLGGWVEVINPNAFDENLATKPDVRGLYNHDANYVLGRSASGTLTLATDATGLSYSIDPPDTQYARDLVTIMKRGDVNQSSFGFICDDAAWGYDEVTGQEIRTVLKAQLFDVSPVTFPAYTASTSEARSYPTDMPAEVRTRLDKRDTNDDDDCDCSCAQCEAGSCGICSNDDCADPNCDCQDQRSLNKALVSLALAETYSL
jgi:uncharacterized protein